MTPTSKNDSLRRIVLSTELPQGGGGILCHYENEPVSVRGGVPSDIREIVSINEEQWLSELEVWHRDLCELGINTTKWWPLLAASRLHR